MRLKTAVLSSVALAVFVFAGGLTITGAGAFSEAGEAYDVDLPMEGYEGNAENLEGQGMLSKPSDAVDEAGLFSSSNTSVRLVLCSAGEDSRGNRVGGEPVLRSLNEKRGRFLLRPLLYLKTAAFTTCPHLHGQFSTIP